MEDEGGRQQKRRRRADEIAPDRRPYREIQNHHRRHGNKKAHYISHKNSHHKVAIFTLKMDAAVRTILIHSHRRTEHIPLPTAGTFHLQDSFEPVGFGWSGGCFQRDFLILGRFWGKTGLFL